MKPGFFLFFGIIILLLGGGLYLLYSETTLFTMSGATKIAKILPFSCEEEIITDNTGLMSESTEELINEQSSDLKKNACKFNSAGVTLIILAVLYAFIVFLLPKRTTYK